MKKKIYENQQIGNFNVLMGYTLGEARYDRPFSINTFQQTYKNDKVIGDLFANVGGKYFILEFKKAFEDCRSELLKPQCQKLISAFYQDHPLNQLSEKGHFLCYGSVEKNQKGSDQLDYKLIPYCQLKTILSREEFTRFNVKDFTLNLINKYSERIPFKVGLNSDEIAKYIDLLKETSGEDSYIASGILTCFDQEKGLISIPFDNLSELEILLKKSPTMKKTIDKKRTRKISRDKGRGMNM